MMQAIQIKNKSTVYFNSITELFLLRDFSKNKTVLFASKKVKELANQIVNILEGVGADLYLYLTDDGESNKNVEKALLFTQYLSYNEIGRNDVIINLGGGTLCDLGGFVASVYMRGMAYINIPTTLLCAVDASIGGKTAINAVGAKNLWGVFCQPESVLIDCNLLKNLPDALLEEGMSEIVKYAVLDSDFANFLKGLQGLNCIKQRLDEIVYYCAKIKASYVEVDEFDKKERKLLNFGHTVAHAIERYSNYKTEHSTAVAYGIIYETKISYANGFISINRYNQIISLCNKFLKIGNQSLNYEILQLMAKYKKNYQDKIVFALPDEKSATVKEFTREELVKLLEKINNC